MNKFQVGQTVALDLSNVDELLYDDCSFESDARGSFGTIAEYDPDRYRYARAYCYRVNCIWFREDELTLID